MSTQEEEIEAEIAARLYYHNLLTNGYDVCWDYRPLERFTGRLRWDTAMVSYGTTFPEVGSERSWEFN